MKRKNIRHSEEYKNEIVKEVGEIGNITLVARK